MTHLESPPAARVPANWHARVGLLLLTCVGGYAALIPFVQESSVLSKVIGLLLGVVVVLGDVWLWLNATRPGFGMTRGAKALRFVVYGFAAVGVVLQIVRMAS
jgi:sorbitol-specific phosphotransferase system component IIBC